ncbi:MAG TPA: AAA family ATPase [Candidatus Poseidoniaceae archaeon]|nr:AAA family ATPase [Candidatus Poseidoniaceae archaeon]
MAKKGSVRRMDSSMPKTANKKMDLGDEMPISWKRGQEHFQRFTELIKIELEDETAMVEERWKKWSKQKLVSAGLTLFDLTSRSQGRFYGDPILVFEQADRNRMPQHRFSHGDIVLISRTRPWGEKVYEGIVLDRGPTRIRVVVNEKPKDVKKGRWRIDKGANRIAHDRMHEALIAFHSTESTGGTPLRDLILGSLHDPATSAARAPEISGKKQHVQTQINPALNESQQNAVEQSLGSRLNLIQGPPGTGKTFTAVHLLKQLAHMGKGPILACAESNVAVDNLLEGLIDIGVRAVRIGKPVKVRETLRNNTLDALAEQHPLQEEIEYIKQQNDELRKNLASLKGKEKGLTHRDIKNNFKDIRNLEHDVIASLLDSAEVICSTTIGAGHHVLGDRKFPIVLIDEATQASEPSALVPIIRGCRQLILVGDHKQLPPTVISEKAEKGGLNQSLFERLNKCGIPAHMLTTQYRMHPVIREFPSARFYDNRLEDGCSANDRPTPAGLLWPDWDNPLAFIPIEGSELQEEDGSSRSNYAEAAKVLSVVKGLLETGDLTAREIGVITPYNGQVRVLSDLFQQAGGREIGGPFNGLEIKSVDGYQGREKEVIVFSTVRANESGEVGFLSDRRRLNVALTRAKRGLIIIGHPTTLRHDRTWDSWLEWVDERNLFAWHLSQD